MVKYKFYLTHLMLVVGIAIILTGVVLYFSGFRQELSFFVFICGLGFLSGLLAECAYVAIRRKTAPEYAYESSDERGIIIKGKAYGFAWGAGSAVLVIAAFAFLFMNNESAFRGIMAAFFIQALSFIAAKSYYNKKM